MWNINRCFYIIGELHASDTLLVQGNFFVVVAWHVKRKRLKQANSIMSRKYKAHSDTIDLTLQKLDIGKASLSAPGGCVYCLQR